MYISSKFNTLEDIIKKMILILLEQHDVLLIFNWTRSLYHDLEASNDQVSNVSSISSSLPSG